MPGRWTSWPTSSVAAANSGVDVFTRQALATEAGIKLRGENVVEVLNRLVARHGAPRYVFVDNGSEFTGRLMDMWAYHHVRQAGLRQAWEANRQQLCRDLQRFATR